jgi:hypothetical protein
MPSQIEKLEAHTSHLLDGFLILRERYAMLDPMLFDQEVIRSRGSQGQARGFRLLRNSLFLACAEDISKLSLDSDARTPSIKKIVSVLDDVSLRDELRERYAIRRIPVGEEESDPDIMAALKHMEQTDEAKRRQQFDDYYNRLTDMWNALSGSRALKAFQTVRDKVTAHTEVQFVNGEYKSVDIGALGLKWKDLKETIATMQELIKLLNDLIRNASFAWELLDQQLSKASAGFWSRSGATH